MEYVKEFFKIIGLIIGLFLGVVVFIWPLFLEGTGYFWIAGVYYGILGFLFICLLAVARVQERR